jgi:hypothetical protein
MEYAEYAIVGLLVLAAGIYAVLRIRRALQGRCDCVFMRNNDEGGGDRTGSGSPCANCRTLCTKTGECSEAPAKAEEEAPSPDSPQ